MPTYSSADIYETIIEIVRMVSFTLPLGQLNIHFERPDFFQIRFDQRRLQQVVLNILSEAVTLASGDIINIKIDASLVEEGDDLFI